MMVLMNLEGNNKDNFDFLQKLRQVSVPTPQLVAKSPPLAIIGSSKPS